MHRTPAILDQPEGAHRKGGQLITELALEIQELAGDTPRFVLGLAGAPASGKSTLAAALARALPEAAVLPMDGFHLDDAILRAHGTLNRKGAPHTFDVDGFISTLIRLKTGQTLFAPGFDRDLEIARAGAVEIPPQTRIVLVEGNYLLHDTGGWQAVRPALDACWGLDVPDGVLQKRLTARWAGYGHSPDRAAARIAENDLPNARLVAASLHRADRLIANL